MTPKERRNRKNIFFWSDGEETKKIRYELKKLNGKNPNLDTDYALWFAIVPRDTNPYDRIDTRLDLLKFKSTLPNKLADIFSMYMEKYTLAEIGVALGIPQASVYRDMIKIKTKLKLFFAEDI